MQIQQLEYFEAVARHLHFTRAALELHVAQPSVSQQIQKLEVELGRALFHRTRRGVELTEAGRLVLPHVRGVLAQVADIAAEVRELSGMRIGTLRIGAPPSIGTHVLPGALGTFSRQYPGISLVVREGGSLSLVEWLVAGELDLAVVIEAGGMTRSRQPALTTEPLFTERLLLAVPRGHRLAARRAIDVAELSQEAFVMLREGAYDLRDQTLAACRAAGFEPRVAIDGSEMDSALRFVAAGLGVAILPASVLDGASPDAPVGVRLSDRSLRRQLVLARRRDRPWSASARVFAGLLRAATSGATAAHPVVRPG
jgi:DNA-binding transcriptional LysR family regulator